MRSHWILIAVLATAIVALALCIRYLERQRVARRTAFNPPQETIDEALLQTHRDSTARGTPGSEEDKSRWVDVVKGFDYSDLAPSRRKAFIRYANAQRCTCGCGYTLAGCRTYDPTCPVSGPRVQALLDSVRAGLLPGSPLVRRRELRGG